MTPEVRVLAVIDSVGYGGAERLLVSILPQMASMGVSCEVAVLQPPLALVKEFESRGIIVHRIGLAHRWLFPVAIYRLWRLCVTRRIQAVWGHLFFGNLYSVAVARILRLKVIWTIHSPAPQASTSLAAWSNRRAWLEMHAGRLANQRVGVSKAIQAEYERAWGWTVLVVYNAVDLSELSKTDTRDETRKAFGIAGDDFLIAVVARYAPEKGQEVLLRALNLLKVEHGWLPKCVMVGEIGNGTYKNQLETMVREWGLDGSVRLQGAIPHSSTLSLLRASDVGVFPSLREPFGIAAAEAMALGVPCVLADTDGLREIAGDSQAALLVPPSDPPALAEAIHGLWSSPDQRAALANRGRVRIAEAFDLQECARRWCEVFGDGRD